MKNQVSREIALRSVACNKLFAATLSAYKLKEQGHKKTYLLSTLPSKEKLLSYPNPNFPGRVMGLAMYDIADKIYSYPDLDKTAFAAFSAESCLKEMVTPKSITPFTNAYPKLKKYIDLKDPKKKINCGMSAAGAALAN